MAHAPASEKQIAFISKLVNDKDINSSASAQEIASQLNTNPDIITKAMASAFIDILKPLPYKNAKAKTQAPAPGYYTLDNKVYKVVKSPNTGNSYAKVLTDNNGWEYAAGFATKVSIPLTLEKAKELGHIYGMCMICGRTLTDETSISQGVGPVCAGKL